jgi:hypothetical protein
MERSFIRQALEKEEGLGWQIFGDLLDILMKFFRTGEIENTSPRYIEIAGGRVSAVISGTRSNRKWQQDELVSKICQVCLNSQGN